MGSYSRSDGNMTSPVAFSILLGFFAPEINGYAPISGFYAPKLNGYAPNLWIYAPN